MVEKKDCPFCDKPDIDDEHVDMCPKNPKNTEPEIPKVQEVINPTGINQICSKCGKHTAVKINAFDWRCPACGDYEIPPVINPK